VEVWRKTTGTSHATEYLNEKCAAFVIARAAKSRKDPMGCRYVIYRSFAVVLRGLRLCDKVSEEKDSCKVKISEVRLRIEEQMAAAGTGVGRVFDRVW
jgi:hypothetical protein